MAIATTQNKQQQRLWWFIGLVVVALLLLMSAWTFMAHLSADHQHHLKHERVRQQRRFIGLKINTGDGAGGADHGDNNDDYDYDSSEDDNDNDNTNNNGNKGNGNKSKRKNNDDDHGIDDDPMYITCMNDSTPSLGYALDRVEESCRSLVMHRYCHRIAGRVSPIETATSATIGQMWDRELNARYGSHVPIPSHISPNELRLAFIILTHGDPKQLFRLLSAIYNENDYYYIHVDSNTSGEHVKTLTNSYWSSLTNVNIVQRHRILWGGAGLMWATIDGIHSLVDAVDQPRRSTAAHQLKRAAASDNQPHPHASSHGPSHDVPLQSSSKRSTNNGTSPTSSSTSSSSRSSSSSSSNKWHFIINLSHSDYPMASSGELRRVLASRLGFNFMNVNMDEDPKWNDGYNEFVECNTHMYRVGDTPRVTALSLQRGAQWWILSYDFAKWFHQSTMIQHLAQLLAHTSSVIEVQICCVA
jgi:hypothetical protein